MDTLLHNFNTKDQVRPEGVIPERRSGQLIEAGLEKYSGSWGKKQAAHLLRRCTFGPNMKDMSNFAEMNLDDAVDAILDFNEETPLPLNYNNANDPYAPVGQTWVGTPFANNSVGQRLNSFLGRWFGNIVGSGNNVGEKMTLFWHNHFVTQINTIREPNYSFNYYRTLRDNALGNFRTLTEKITVDAAMLRYLNGNENIVGRPNENFAREILELFTIGKGPQIAPGNYTNYTEDDVLAAAKVLTGWRTLRDTYDTKFFPALHDKTVKQFSSAFGNATIENNDENEYKDLIDMILQQDETAKHICRKLYRWFVYYEIDEQTEANVIAPMADILRQNDYEMKPALKALFSSAHFYDNWNIGCVIKSPIDFVANIYRHIELEFPTDLNGSYQAWLALGVQYAAVQEMLLGEPPSVAGWPAMHQAPSYHRFWLTSVSAPYRAVLGDYLAGVEEIKGRGYSLRFNDIALAEQTSLPSNPNQLIKDLAEFFLPLELTQLQLDYLKSNLLPDGLQDYQWTAVWTAYVNDPDNTENTNIVRYLLRNLYRAIFNIAEYNLS